MARQAHLNHYLNMAEAAVPHYRGPDQDMWVERLLFAEDNLRTALSWALDDAANYIASS